MFTEKLTQIIGKQNIFVRIHVQQNANNEKSYETLNNTLLLAIPILLMGTLKNEMCFKN